MYRIMVGFSSPLQVAIHISEAVGRSKGSTKDNRSPVGYNTTRSLQPDSYETTITRRALDAMQSRHFTVPNAINGTHLSRSSASPHLEVLSIASLLPRGFLPDVLLTRLCSFSSTSATFDRPVHVFSNAMIFSFIAIRTCFSLVCSTKGHFGSPW